MDSSGIEFLENSFLFHSYDRMIEVDEDPGEISTLGDPTGAGHIMFEAANMFYQEDGSRLM